jgi:hypothetical protein
LESLTFDRGQADFAVEAGRTVARECTLAGADLRVDLAGSVDFEGNLAASATFGVGGNLAERLAAMGWPLEAMTQDGAHRRLPLAVPVRGTLADPHLQLGMADALQHVLRKATGRQPNGAPPDL